MNTINLLLLNLTEVRRRSIKVWKTIPNDKLDWKPDNDALSCAEMIRHVLASDYGYLQVIENRGSLENPEIPFDTRDFISVHEELDFAKPYREKFINLVKSLSNEDLDNIKIDRSDLTQLGYTGYIRSLGDMLLRIAYHEGVHTGQLLDYMRTMKIERPDIWD
ncbi:DinB family protein [Bacillus paramycoides]|uniref:DinB family protein n=1 Tax=Bacillus paramycoides TaxID=2026194 RepID=UPI003D1F4923